MKDICMHQIILNQQQKKLEIQSKNYWKNLRLQQKHLMIKKFPLIRLPDEEETEAITNRDPKVSTTKARGQQKTF